MGYDISDRASYENTSSWMKAVYDARGEEVVVCLCGNKSDLAANADGRKVDVEEAKRKAAGAGAMFFETSAKAGDGVTELFTELASSLLPANAKEHNLKPG